MNGELGVHKEKETTSFKNKKTKKRIHYKGRKHFWRNNICVVRGNHF